MQTIYYLDLLINGDTINAILALASFPDKKQLGYFKPGSYKKTQNQCKIDPIRKGITINSTKPSYPSYLFFIEAVYLVL